MADISTNVSNLVSSSKVKFLSNPHLKSVKNVALYHLNLNPVDDDLKTMFDDVKFVCIGGTVRRMKEFANLVAQELGLNGERKLTDLAASGQRYSMFKVGPVLCVNHGMGYPSIMILLVEIIKLLFYAEVEDPIIFRIGTSGGLNEPLGTVVITDEVVNDYFESDARIPVLGKLTLRPAVVDQKLANEVKVINEKNVNFPLKTGKTMSHEHLFETTAMKNNVVCDVTDEERDQFFDRMKQNEIVNLDMESLILFSMTHRLGIKAGCITVVVNNILADVMEAKSAEQLLEWELRPQKVVLEYIKHYLKNSRS